MFKFSDTSFKCDFLFKLLLLLLLLLLVVVVLVLVVVVAVVVVVIHVPANENLMLVWSELKTDAHRKKNFLRICMLGIVGNKFFPKVIFTSREPLLKFQAG